MYAHTQPSPISRAPFRWTVVSEAPDSSGISNPTVISDIEAFANFMRLLAPPTPAPPTLKNNRSPRSLSFTGAMIASGSATGPSAALSNQNANLFSDLLVHHMGRGLADGITQGGAGPDEI